MGVLLRTDGVSRLLQTDGISLFLLSSPLSKRVQSSAPGELIELFKLDLTPVNPVAPILYFYPGSDETQPLGNVLWLGNSFSPLAMSFEGADVTGKGAVPRPILSVSNIFGTISGLINLWGDIRGSILTRWETFSNYLDNGPQPDPRAFLPLDQWKLDRIVKMNKLEVQIECRSFFDYQGVKLPKRQVLRNYCNLYYRVYSDVTHSFDYTHATCPYVGTQGFDALGNQVSDPHLDVCSQTLNQGCLRRFAPASADNPGGVGPLNGVVPFGGFPGAGQFTS